MVYIGQTIKLQSWNGFQRRKQRASKLRLICADGDHSFLEVQTPTLIMILCQRLQMLAAKLFSHPFKILDGTKHTGYAFVILSTSFELAWKIIRCRADFVGKQLLQQLTLAIQDTCMRPEKFI